MRGSAALVVLVVLGGLVSQTTSSQPSRELRVGEADTTAVIESSTTSVAPSTTVARSGGDDAAAPAAVDTPDVDNEAPVGASGSRVGLSGIPPVAAASPNAATAHPAPNQAATNRAAGGRSAAAPNAATGTAAGGGTASGAPHVTTFGSQAGTVEVVYTDTSMSIESVSPLPGWSVATTEAGDAAIQVTFESESGEVAAVDVEVHLDDGVPVVGAADETVEETLGGAGDLPDLEGGS